MKIKTSKDHWAKDTGWGEKTYRKNNLSFCIRNRLTHTRTYLGTLYGRIVEYEMLQSVVDI
jgi:hypothetical protein